MKIIVEEDPISLQWSWFIKLENSTRIAQSCRAYGTKKLASKSAGRMAEIMFPRPTIELKELTPAQRDLARICGSR